MLFLLFWNQNSHASVWARVGAGGGLGSLRLNLYFVLPFLRPAILPPSPGTLTF